MDCQACQRENRPGARFCAGCGAALATPCSACGAALPHEAAFCDACGAPVGGARVPARTPATTPTAERDPRAYTPHHLADRILTHRSALEGERKHVTVLFADVAGFTAMSENVDPEEVHARMDRFFQRVLDEVHRYEGTVNQFLGDGVMALFGAPVALEDAPRRALAAALAIQRGVAALGPGGRRLPLRVGIHSGNVVVGRIGDDLRMDYTAVGDTTNLAARLQQLASPGEILISNATRRLVQGFFELEDAGRHEVRGKSQPVHAHRVLRERAVAGRVDALADTGLTPLVGRRRELEALATAFAAAREGRGQACFLVGDAGIGKSRLLFEFRRSLREEPHTWFEGRCASYGSTTAFQFLVDGLQRFFGIEERDDDRLALEKVGAGVSALGEDLAWITGYIQKLLSLPLADGTVAELDAITRRSETIRALHALFLRSAERQPLVFAVEDLHWIDPASEEFLAFLIDAVPTARACLLLTHRPGYHQPFGDRSYHVRVALQPLSPDEMAHMAGSLLSSAELPRELRALIAKKAEGNPFFVEEVTKSLLEEGALRIDGDRVALARPLEEIAVPDSIQDVLMARIDRLDAEPKRAIQVASVIGREFALRLLERIVEAGEAMHGVVSELRALELIYQKAAHPELAFMFKHALTHDVAYESVLLQRRRALHGIVGHAIEELYPDRMAEHYEALAHHFEQAEDWARALLYHERAGDKARDAYANQSAALHYRAALSVAERLGDAVPPAHRALLADQLGHVCYCVNEFRESGDAYVRAAELGDDEAARATSLARAAHAYLWGHHYDEADATASAAVDLARSCDCDSARSIALAALAHHATTRGGLAALPDADPEPSAQGDALPGESKLTLLARRSGDDEALANALTLDGLWAEMRGAYRSAIALSETALASALRTRLPQLTVMPRWVVGLARTCLGDYGPAIATLRESLDLCSRIGDRALKSRLLNSLGWCFAEFGCHRMASEFNREGAELAAQLEQLELVAGAPEIHCNARINLACNHVALGHVDEGLALLEPIRAELETPGDPWQRWRYGIHVRDALARAWLARGEPERALALSDDELEMARHQLSRKLEARALELRGRTLVHLDRRDEAERSLGEALAVARDIGYPPVTWRALSLLAELARRRGESGTAAQRAGEASALVTRLMATLPETELREEMGAMADRIVRAPLEAYR